MDDKDLEDWVERNPVYANVIIPAGIVLGALCTMTLAMYLISVALK